MRDKQKCRGKYMFGRKREREIERDFLFFESASGRFGPTTPV